jgi:hypothetical protein
VSGLVLWPPLLEECKSQSRALRCHSSVTMRVLYECCTYRLATKAMRTLKTHLADHSASVCVWCWSISPLAGLPAIPYLMVRFVRYSGPLRKQPIYGSSDSQRASARKFSGETFSSSSKFRATAYACMLHSALSCVTQPCTPSSGCDCALALGNFADPDFVKASSVTLLDEPYHKVR